MDDKKILDKLDKIEDRLDGIDITLAKQEINLAEHMRRSDSIESYVQHLEDKFVPVEKHVIMVNGIVKFIGIISIIGTIVLTLLQIFRIL